jgi:predicted metal-dependent phosphoesterase TrpH
MLDLHVHSSYSDGSETPEALVALAKAAHVRALALTDHDNAFGVPEFLAACREAELVGIAGVEVSANVESGTLHILGLGIDAGNEALRDALNEVLEGREERNMRILEKLQDLGFNITYDEVLEMAGEDVVGRPHFAQVMVARGWVDSIEEAFSRYLEKGAAAYVNRFRFQPEEAIAIIRGAGGVPVMAHPMSVTEDFAELREVVANLTDAGLRGIEAYYNGHSPETTLECLRLAKRYGLLVTGGSDFHGEDVKPGIRIGIGNGSLFVPDRLLEPLLAEINSKGCFIPNIRKEVHNE